MRRLKATSKRAPILRISAGDLLFGHPAVISNSHRKYWAERARLIGRMLSSCSIEYAALGDADMTMGLKFACSALAPLECKLLSSNVVPKDATPLTPKTIFERGGFKVGLFALTRRPVNGLPQEVDTITDPVNTAKETVAELKKAGCNLIILLAHLGAHEDQCLLRKVPGVDLAICGCCPGPLEIPRKIGNTVYFSAMFGGGQLGRIDIIKRKDDGSLDFHHTLIPMDKKIAADVGTQDRIRALELSFRTKTQIVSKSTDGTSSTGQSKPQNNRSYWGVDYCSTCHPNQTTAWHGSLHSKALNNLPPEARENPECLECHTTGMGASANFSLGQSTALPGVQCEACHAVHPAHPRGRHSRVSTGIGECFRCHTPIRSPNFSHRRDWKRVACPKDGGSMVHARSNMTSVHREGRRI